MAKDSNVMVFDGVVSECLPCDEFMVKVVSEEGIEKLIKSRRSGRMKKNKIKVILHDKVSIEVSPYDITKGRITTRTKA